MNNRHSQKPYFFLTLLLACAAFRNTGRANAADSDSAYVRKTSWAETMSATRAKSIRLAGPQPESTGPVFRPYDSGTIAGDGPARHISLNVTGVKTLRLIAICEQGTANCNIWGEPRLIAKDGTETRLTVIKPVSVKQGWGSMLTDANWQNHPLQVGGQKFQYGIWIHADSEIAYTLDGKFERFEAFAGEDTDRANGRLRFKVLSSEGIKLPPSWADITGDFPVQSGWLLKDAGEFGIADWFIYRTDAQTEQNFIDRAIKQVAPLGRALEDELDALCRAKVPPGDPRWLDLYGRACRYREGMAIVNSIGPDDKADFEKELEALMAAKVPAEDAKWREFARRTVKFVETEDQFGAIAHDISQRATFNTFAPETFRTESLILAADRDPTDVVLRRTAALLADLKKNLAADITDSFTQQLADLQKKGADTAVTDTKARRTLFGNACALRRQIAFSNPLLNFDKLLFIKRHRAVYDHMCDQFYGIAAAPGGGLFILDNPFGPDPHVRDVLANSTVEKGKLKGTKLWGGPTQTPTVSYDGGSRRSGTDTGGSFLSPSLSYDGKTILFSYVENTGEPTQSLHTDPARGHWDEGRAYHIFKVNVDGSGLQQLTDGSWNDIDPCWLPNGRIAFITERRGGYLRCGRACPLYTLFDMAQDGSRINELSFHESNEWNPSVTHDGRIIYTRWDYVDRHGCVAHGPWITTLNGTDSRSVHGNFAPRPLRPDMEVEFHAIPNSHKYVALAAPHHGQAFGSLIVVDPRIPDDDAMGPVKRLTPDVGFPESQGGQEAYGSPHPLSEDYHLCVYDAGRHAPSARGSGGRYGIYLVDSFGNKELIYRDPGIGCMTPIPLRPTPLPPVTKPASLAGAEPENIHPNAPGEATMAVVNVYDSIAPWPENMKIKALRIYQLLPMSVPSGGPPHQTGRQIAEAGDSVVPCRWVLGTVPIEADGSAYFVIPAYREVFFQAVDEKGMAVQSMRSATYARKGERLVCQGCHEPKNRTPEQNKPTPLALKRAPSTPTPDVSGSKPFSYPLLVQPVLDRNCVACHDKNKDKKAPNLNKEPFANNWYASYNSLINFAYTSYGAGGDWKSPMFYQTTPGKFGARATRLYEMLTKGHHDVKLSDEDMHRITLWLDSSSMFYGVFEKEGGEAQLRGEIAKATLE